MRGKVPLPCNFVLIFSFLPLFTILDDFKCTDRRSCISRNLVCDGRSHCRDSSDEVNCPTVASPAALANILKCRTGSRLCKDGTECVLYSHVCDGEKDCRDGSDEQECGEFPKKVILIGKIAVTKNNWCNCKCSGTDNLTVPCNHYLMLKMLQIRRWLQHQIFFHSTKCYLSPHLMLRLSQPAAVPLCSVPVLLFTSAFPQASFVMDAKTVLMALMNRTVWKDVPQKVSIEMCSLRWWWYTFPCLKCYLMKHAQKSFQSILKLGTTLIFNDFHPDNFRCKDRSSCISKSLVCDGRSHCNDGSDEVNCQSIARPTALSNVLKCRMGSRLCQDGTECVLFSHVCDGERDCRDGSDEEGCSESGVLDPVLYLSPLSLM